METNTTPAKLRTVIEVPGADDLSTRWVVRTVWFKGGDHLAETMEHETAPFTTKAEAECWAQWA